VEKKILLSVLFIGVLLVGMTVGFFEILADAANIKAGSEETPPEGYIVITVYAHDVNPHVNVVAKPITKEMITEYEGEI
jgi:hypothetical protein